jgi:capsule polysaccharide export protein KpsE/RkpR
MEKEQLIDNFNKLNDNSNLDDIQQYIADMMKVNKFDNSSLELFCYLTEEIGELNFKKEINK